MKTRRWLVAGAVGSGLGAAGLGIYQAMQVSAFATEQGAPPRLEDYGPAPEFAGLANWINSEPLSVSALRGRVVLVDFWTFGCSNCVRTLPFVRRWHETYRNQGLAVVGVHTPEFAFEREWSAVKAAAARHHLGYPIAQDNRYATWTAFQNQFWPAVYLIDRQGRLRLKHFGEGDYAAIEVAIRKLLGDSEKSAAHQVGQDDEPRG